MRHHRQNILKSKEVWLLELYSLRVIPIWMQRKMLKENQSISGTDQILQAVKNHAIKGANKLTYTLTDKDDKKYITFKVTPIAKKGSVKGQKISCTSKKIVQINYGCQVKLGTDRKRALCK